MHSRKARRELVKNLQRFDSLSNNKPFVFVDIKYKYNNDIKRYVRHLYRKSMLLNYFQLQRYDRHPSLKRLQRDPGVQFVIAMALYNAWIKQEKTTDGQEKTTSGAAAEQK